MALTKQRAIELLKRQQSFIDSLKEMGRDSREFTKWDQDTVAQLRQIEQVFPAAKNFRLKCMNISYDSPHSWLDARRGYHPAPQYYRRGFEEASDVLQSLIEHMGEFWLDDEANAPEEPNKTAGPSGSDVFIAYGHDDLARHEVADFVRSLGFNPVVYENEPGKGRTTIEKIEDLAANIGFAVVLMTPDDIGAAKDKENNLQPRARQNVIFELGYFAKALGRGRVVALRKGCVEIPSNYDGVEYIKFEGNWKLKLAKEIKAANLPIDPDKMI